MKSVAVLGATPKPDRYAFAAMQQLQGNGWNVIPVNPAFSEVLGKRCHASIADVPEPIDTVTMYLSPARSTPLIDEIIRAKPGRIICNPGAENDELAKAARLAGIQVINDCMLVMLADGRF